MRKSVLLKLSASVVLALTASQVLADYQYKVVNYLPKTRVYAINENGQMAGQNGNTASLWENGHLTNLGVVPGGSTSYANAINNNKQVVGNVYVGNAYHAFLWQNGAMTDLNLGNFMSMARGINDKGQIVGCRWASSNSPGVACLWDNGTITDFSTGDASIADAYAINESSQVTGDAFFGNGGQHAFFWSAGKATDLGVPSPNYSYSTGRAISDNGIVVGYTADPNVINSYTAFEWRNGTRTSLGKLNGQSTYAEGVNIFGQVVGEAGAPGGGDFRAFLYQGGQMYDLTNVTALLGSGVVLGDAVAINNHGTIVCSGGVGSDWGIYELAPIPEPSSLLSLLCGAGGLAGMIRLRTKTPAP